MFTFKVVARDNMNIFIDNLSTSAAVVILDKNIVTKQMVLECLNMGVTPIIPSRREFLDNKLIIENFIVNDDVFDIADLIANYCQYWLVNTTTSIKDAMTSIADQMDLNNRGLSQFGMTVSSIFGELQESRGKMFTDMKEMIVNG